MSHTDPGMKVLLLQGCTGIGLCVELVWSKAGLLHHSPISRRELSTLLPFLWEPSILCLADLRPAVAKPDPSIKVHKAGTDGGEVDRQREQQDPLASSEPCPQCVWPKPVIPVLDAIMTPPN